MLPGDGAVGLGWRPETAWLVDREHRAGRLGFSEVVVESLRADGGAPAPLDELVARGCCVIPHGVGLGLGGAERPDPGRLARLARLARRLRAPLVSEHVAFVRGGGREVEHLLPVPRTREVLAILIENVRLAQDALPVPLALENIAHLFPWPDPGQIFEADFLAELVDATGVGLLLDLSNLDANARNFGWDPAAYLDRLPLHAVRYVHLAGGVQRGAVYHDTHADPIGDRSLALLDALRRRLGRTPPALLERDGGYGRAEALAAEVAAIAEVAGG